MPVKITVKEPAARFQVLNRKIYGFFVLLCTTICEVYNFEKPLVVQELQIAINEIEIVFYEA